MYQEGFRGNGGTVNVYFRDCTNNSTIKNKDINSFSIEFDFGSGFYCEHKGHRAYNIFDTLTTRFVANDITDFNKGVFCVEDIGASIKTDNMELRAYGLHVRMVLSKPMINMSNNTMLILYKGANKNSIICRFYYGKIALLMTAISKALGAVLGKISDLEMYGRTDNTLDISFTTHVDLTEAKFGYLLKSSGISNCDKIIIKPYSYFDAGKPVRYNAVQFVIRP